MERAGRNRKKGRRSEKGQALVELALFGAFFLLIFGVLLSYGLKYNYQQRAQMTAFRRALKIASDQDRGEGSAMVLEDRSTPDPMQMFGAGSTQPIVASASVNRDYQMNAQIVDADSLTGTALDMQTKRNDTTGDQEWMRRVYKTAAFRVEYNVPTSAIGKYKIVYGGARVRSTSGSWVDSEDGSAETSCAVSHEETNPETGEVTTVCDAGETFAAVRVIDSCSGEIVDYNTCYNQAHMLVEPSYCANKCTMAQIPGSSTDCSGECAQATNPPNQNDTTFDKAQGGAWYAADWTKLPAGCAYPSCQYTFPFLNTLFGFGVSPASSGMLLQPDYTLSSERQEVLTKTETNATITTKQSASWSDVLNRDIVHQENVDNAGYEIPHDTPGQYINLAVEAVPSEISGSTSATWETAK
jgi:hypothetical protein